MIKRLIPLDFQWPTLDPFLFCVHHDDAYPAGNEEMGPDASLHGRMIGQDFEPREGWRMYHGDKVPGFPVHPHRGFETVTIVQKGIVDHADSMGAAGRYGQGDTQWMTAGAGVQHSEMFPLLRQDRDNPLELFQIWLNLPAANKMVAPHFAMLWGDKIPRHQHHDEAGRVTEIEIVAGKLDAVSALAPPPDSWAANPENDVAIWIISMEPGACWSLPATSADANRVLYFFEGASLAVGSETVSVKNGIELDAASSVDLENGDEPTRLLLLQGRPIAEPVAQYGPFVMNTSDEIRQAFADYRRTEFGGWPWPRADFVHPRTKGRFARYSDGTEEERQNR
ncbi:MAG: pirin family protein [Acidiferrobacterales bacterium]|nr:pirin family protein [Acidiferrobacterales bacterium]